MYNRDTNKIPMPKRDNKELRRRLRYEKWVEKQKEKAYNFQLLRNRIVKGRNKKHRR